MSLLLKPLKRLGQNFLIDKNIVDKVLGAASLARRDVILEIGPGHGVLTFAMALRGCRVVAVEIDRGLCQELRERSAGLRRFRLLHRDILKFDLKRFAREERIPRFKVVASLPYYITTPVLEYLFRNISRLDDIFIMVQKEVARRIKAHPGQDGYGSLTCFVNYFTEPRLLFDIKRGSFWPTPKVDSCFLRLRPREDPRRRLKLRSQAFFFKVVRAAFGQRRKRLFASLSRVISRSDMDRLASQDLLERRPETLSLEDFARLSNDAFDFLKAR